MESEGRLLHTNSCEPGSLDRSSDQSFCPQCQNQDMLHRSGTPIDISNSEDLIIPSVKFNLGTEANSLSWDYSTLPINHARRHPLPESVSRAERTKSFPPPLQKLRPGLQLDDLGNPEWGSSGLSVFAPLASPETLSEASSLDTMSSKQCSDGYQRTSRLDPIPASPIRPTAVGHLYATPTASPVDYVDSFRTPSELNGNDASYDNIAADISPVTPTVVPLAQSTPIKPDVIQNETASEVSELLDNTLFSEIDETHRDNARQLNSSEDLGVRPLSMEADQTNLTDIENRVKDKMVEMMNHDPYRLTYDSDNETRNSTSLPDFTLHSPDSTSNQYLYDDYGGHYSPAGRGYPHGSYAPDVVNTDDLVPDVDENSDANLDEEITGLSSSPDGKREESDHLDVDPERQVNEKSPSLQNVPQTATNVDSVENNTHTSPDSCPVSPLIPSTPKEVLLSSGSNASGDISLEIPNTMPAAQNALEASVQNEYIISPKSLSRSSSDASLADNDCVHQPLLNKRESCASTASHSSRRTLTNGSDLEDRSSMNSYEQNVLLLGDEIDPCPQSNGVKVTLTEQHSFGETYYV